jgi:hypothetical protein
MDRTLRKEGLLRRRNKRDSVGGGDGEVETEWRSLVARWRRIAVLPTP